MYYHSQLANRLDLPARPTSMRFEQIAHVTQAEVETARASVVRQETPSALKASIESRDFWYEFLEKKHPETFSLSDEPFAQRLDVLFSQRQGLSSGTYLESLNTIREERNQARGALITRLTTTELQEHPLPGPIHQAEPQAGD